MEMSTETQILSLSFQTPVKEMDRRKLTDISKRVQLTTDWSVKNVPGRLLLKD